MMMILLIRAILISERIVSTNSVLAISKTCGSMWNSLKEFYPDCYQGK